MCLHLDRDNGLRGVRGPGLGQRGLNALFDIKCPIWSPFMENLEGDHPDFGIVLTELILLL